MLGKPSPLPPGQWGSPDMRQPFKPTLAQRAWMSSKEVYPTSGWNRPRYKRSYHMVSRVPGFQTYSPMN